MKMKQEKEKKTLIFGQWGIIPRTHSPHGAQGQS